MRSEDHIFNRPADGWQPRKLFPLGDSVLLEWEAQGEGDPILASRLTNCDNKRGFCSLSQVPTLLKECQAAAPALFIFHASRCGSSVLAGYFETDPMNRVFFEPRAARRYFLRGDIAHTRDNTWALIKSFGLGGSPQQRRLIIKFNSLLTPYAHLVREAFPEVPIVFVYRHPLEILVSLHQRPSGFLLPRTRLFIARYLDMGEAEANTAPIGELAARLLQRLLTCVVNADANTVSHLINHSEFPSAPIDLEKQLFPDAERRDETAEELLGRHFGSNKPFRSDSPRKQGSADTSLRDYFRRFELDRLYEELEETRKRQASS